MRIVLYFCLISVGFSMLGCTGIFPKQEHTSDIEKVVSDAVDFPVLLYSEDPSATLSMSSSKSDELLFSDFFTQNRPVILHFWAGLCPFCREDIQTMQVIHETYGDEIIVFGLDVGPLVGLGSVDDGKNLRGESNATYHMGTTSDKNVARSFQITGTPTTIVFDIKGQPMGVWNGMHSIRTVVDVMSMINELLPISSDQTS